MWIRIDNVSVFHTDEFVRPRYLEFQRVVCIRHEIASGISYVSRDVNDFAFGCADTLPVGRQSHGSRSGSRLVAGLSDLFPILIGDGRDGSRLVGYKPERLHLFLLIDRFPTQGTAVEEQFGAVAVGVDYDRYLNTLFPWPVQWGRICTIGLSLHRL